MHIWRAPAQYTRFERNPLAPPGSGVDKFRLIDAGIATAHPLASFSTFGEAPTGRTLPFAATGHPLPFVATERAWSFVKGAGGLGAEEGGRKAT